MSGNNPLLSKMQWFLLILTTLWLIAAMVIPLVAFCISGNILSLSFFGTLLPPIYIMRRIIWYAFPKDDRDYKLAKVKAKYATQIQRDKKRVSILEGD